MTKSAHQRPTRGVTNHQGRPQPAATTTPDQKPATAMRAASGLARDLLCRRPCTEALRSDILVMVSVRGVDRVAPPVTHSTRAGEVLGRMGGGRRCRYSLHGVAGCC